MLYVFAYLVTGYIFALVYDFVWERYKLFSDTFISIASKGDLFIVIVFWFPTLLVILVNIVFNLVFDLLIKPFE